MLTIALAPSRYVHTPILSDKVINYLTSKGVNFATVEDCAAAILRIASDQSLHGNLNPMPKAHVPNRLTGSRTQADHLALYHGRRRPRAIWMWRMMTIKTEIL